MGEWAKGEPPGLGPGHRASSILASPTTSEKRRADKRRQWRDWYRRNKSVQSKKVYFNRGLRRAKLKAWLGTFKATLVCSRCGFDHVAALDFHHRDASVKGFSIAMVDRWTQSIARLKTEIAKCDVLCANCHRIEHWQRRNRQRT